MLARITKMIASPKRVSITNPVTASVKTFDLIKSFESYSAQAYLCPAGKWTIGYGSTIYKNDKPVQRGDTIKRAQALELLQHDIDKIIPQLNKLLKVRLSPCQHGALVSFTYNCGIGNLKNSTLLRKINADPNNHSIATEFGKWIKGKGKVLPGLIRRRAAEAAFYFAHTCQS